MSLQAETDAEDVTQWLLIEREPNPHALNDLIARFLYFEQQIRGMDAFCKRDEALPGRELTPKAESRAVAIGRGVVKAMMAGQRRGWDEALERAAARVDDSLSGEPNERAIGFGKDMVMSPQAAKKAA